MFHPTGTHQYSQKLHIKLANAYCDKCFLNICAAIVTCNSYNHELIFRKYQFDNKKEHEGEKKDRQMHTQFRTAKLM